MKNRLFFAICILAICFSCNKGEEEVRYTTTATILLINETSEVVKSHNSLGYVIQPGETLIHKETYTNEYGAKPTVDTYQPFPEYVYPFIYENNSKCEKGLRDIKNYENRKEISHLKFEFTFHFTEEKKNNSTSCSF